MIEESTQATTVRRLSVLPSRNAGGWFTHQRPAVDGERLTTHRFVSLLATLSLFGVAFESWGSPVQMPLTGALVALVFGVGLIVGPAVAVASSERVLARLDLVLLALAVVALTAQALNALYLNPGYGTDEAAFEQAAANLLIHGHDPYGANLIGALSQFRVPIQYATSTLSGGTVSTFGYPAFPMLVSAVAVLLTGGTQAVPIATVAVLLVAALVMFRLLPPRLRAAAIIVCVGLPLLFGFAASGVNAIICMALLIPVAYRWSSVGYGGRLTGPQRLQGVAFGLAVSTQQLAWFVTPFLLVGIYLLRRRGLGARGALRVVVAYVTYAAGAFALVNGPFMVWSFHAWLHGVAGPLLQNAIPYGQGLIDLTLFMHLGGGDLSAYNYCAIALLLGLLALYALNFTRLARSCFLLPVLPLFYATRSLAEYFITLAAVMVMSVLTLDSYSLSPAVGVPLPRWMPSRRLLSGLCLLPAVAWLVVALVAPQPLSLRVTGFTTTGQLQSIWRLDVAVDNSSGKALSPRFATNSIGQATTFWNIASGPRSLRPHTRATYVLDAPNVGSMAGISSPLTLEAFTDSPSTVSSTGLITPESYSATLLPSYVDRTLSSGAATQLTVQLRSPLGANVHKAGVRVALGQLIYAQTGLILSQARINNSPEGATPVFASTNAHGQATFRLTDSAPQQRPIYFQAWVQPIGHYPFGYSELVSVLWR